MSSIHPPPEGRDTSGLESVRGAGPTRRPRYLVVALVAALVFGAGCWTEGCGRLGYYRGESHEHHAHLTASINDEADRAEAEALYQRFEEVADASRGRAIPMAAATFVLGAALLALAGRGLAGRSNRSALMQVVAAQAIVVAAGYFVTREMVNAEADWQYEIALIHQRERLSPDQYQQVVPTLRAIRRWAPPAWLVFRTVASGLIIVALSRPRSREFFEAAARPLSER